MKKKTFEVGTFVRLQGKNRRNSLRSYAAKDGAIAIVSEAPYKYQSTSGEKMTLLPVYWLDKKGNNQSMGGYDIEDFEEAEFDEYKKVKIAAGTLAWLLHQNSILKGMKKD